MTGRSLIPAESLTKYPERNRDGYKEQAQTNRTSPAEPRSPRAPMFKAVLVAVVKLSFVVFGSFAIIWHNIPLLIDESLSPLEFDEASKRRRLTHSLCGFYAVHVIRRMSSACI